MASFSTRTLFFVFIFLTGMASANLLSGLLPLNLYLSLSLNFYDNTKCRDVALITRRHVEAAVKQEPRMGASLLRLFFHDCFVNGCDGSILLNDTPTFIGEKTALPNANSVRGYEVIDSIKADLEKKCPGTVSCADIVALAARDAVVLLGGPSWGVPLGRKDSTTASKNAANSNLPSPFADLSTLKTNFSNKGFNEREMVALSGGHTIGKARCRVFRNRIYNDTNINSDFATSLKPHCSSVGGADDNNLSPFDGTQYAFDNVYFQDLENRKGLLHSDQELFNGGSTDALVRTYSQYPTIFMSDFKAAMVKMGKLAPPPGTGQEIRSQCWKINGS